MMPVDLTHGVETWHATSQCAHNDNVSLWRKRRHWNRLFVTSAILIIGLAGVLPAQQTTTTTTQRTSPPQAKTQKEFADYNAAYATTGGAAVEKAADSFAAAYPQSELRSYLYAKAMHEYQNENNSDKMLAMGNKVIGLDPDNSVALVLTATLLADSLADSKDETLEKDRAQKIAAIQKNATHALDAVDGSFTPPQNATPEQIAAYKSTLRSMARSALGIMELKNGNDAQAEKDLQEAASLNKVAPDPYIWYHLALAQDHQRKYAEALASINQALQCTASNPDLEKLAKGERQRLVDLAGSAPESPQKPPRQ